MLSMGFPICVDAIYSIWVSYCVTNSSNQPLTENKGFDISFSDYFLHLVIRFLSGILFTILQHAALFPSGFEYEFSCSLPSTNTTSKTATNANASQSNSAFFTCYNITAYDKEHCPINVFRIQF